MMRMKVLKMTIILLEPFFRVNLVGYDKEKKLYFPIIVEFCTYKFTFLDDTTMKIVYESGEKFEINLEEIIFKK